jgi:hypothetical protein
MLEREIGNVIESLKERLALKPGPRLYLKTARMDLPALQEEVRPVAEERLKKSLVLLGCRMRRRSTQSGKSVETARTLEMMSDAAREEARRLSERETVSNLVEIL